MSKCPCKGCLDRTITCHYEGYCDKWAEWKAEDQARREWLRSFNPVVSDHAKKRERERIRKKARGWDKPAGKRYGGDS